MQVPASVYDEDYYLSACLGHEEWARSDGHEAAGIYAGVLARAGLSPGEVVVDLGTGRGELPAVAVESGAAFAYGVEYSSDAVRLAERTIDARGVGDRVSILQADVRRVPLDDGIADLVTLIDVVEHLTRDELFRALVEARRLLRPGGRVFAHTMPNRTVYRWTYRAQRALRGRSWPKDPRNEWEHRMHVNEQTCTSLRRVPVAGRVRRARRARRRDGLRGVRARRARARAVLPTRGAAADAAARRVRPVGGGRQALTLARDRSRVSAPAGAVS